MNDDMFKYIIMLAIIVLMCLGLCGKVMESNHSVRHSNNVETIMETVV